MYDEVRLALCQLKVYLCRDACIQNRTCVDYLHYIIVKRLTSLHYLLKETNVLVFIHCNVR